MPLAKTDLPALQVETIMLCVRFHLFMIVSGLSVKPTLARRLAEAFGG
jgi:hypothetical protein